MRKMNTTNYRNASWEDNANHRVSESKMNCLRCQGLLVQEFCSDLQDGTGENWFWALRCLQCGEVLDPLILQNRSSKSQTVLKGRSRQKSPVALS